VQPAAARQSCRFICFGNPADCRFHYICTQVPDSPANQGPGPVQTIQQQKSKYQR
jgi:hypothetical protein